MRLHALSILALFLAAACHGPGSDGGEAAPTAHRATVPVSGATLTLSLVDSTQRIVGTYNVQTALPDGTYAVEYQIDGGAPQVVGSVVIDARAETSSSAPR